MSDPADSPARPARPARPIRLSLVLDIADGVGGAEHVLLDTFRHLDPERIRPELVSLRDGGSMVTDFREAGFAVHELGRTGRFDLASIARLWRHFRTGKPDVVLVAHFQRASLTLGRWVGKLAGVPRQVLAVHDMDLTSVGLRCLPKHVVNTLALTDALALLGESQRAYLHREEGVGAHPWSRTAEYVVPNGIAPTDPPPPAELAATRRAVRAELGVADEAMLLGVVARLTPQKAHHLLFEALRGIADVHDRLRVAVVGDGPRRAELEALLAEQGLTDVVTMLGERHDVPRLLTGFDATALSSRHEGVPMAVIESMGAGLPVVAPAVGGLPDLVRDEQDGFLVPVGDTEALGKRIRELATDPELRRTLGAHAREHARGLTIEATADAFTAMVEAVVGR